MAENGNGASTEARTMTAALGRDVEVLVNLRRDMTNSYNGVVDLTIPECAERARAIANGFEGLAPKFRELADLLENPPKAKEKAEGGQARSSVKVAIAIPERWVTSQNAQKNDKITKGHK